MPFTERLITEELTEEDVVAIMLDDLNRPSIEHIGQILIQLYHNVCGDAGIDVFQSTTLQRLKTLYGIDPKKYGVKGADIIKLAGDQPLPNIHAFLDGVIPSSEVSFLLENRHKILEKMAVDIPNLIASGRVKSRFKHLNGINFKDSIAAILVGGSYAYSSFDPKSDIDVQYLINNGSDTLVPYFSEQLSSLIQFHPRVDDMDIPISPSRLPELDYGDSKLLVYTPFDDIREFLNNVALNIAL